MRFVIIILLFISCTPQRVIDTRSACNIYAYSDQEYNIADKGNPYHLPRQNYIYTNDTLLVIINIQEDFYHAIPFYVETTLDGYKCKYRTGNTLFVLDKKLNVMTVNHVGLDTVEPFWLYQNLQHLDIKEANEIINDTY